ncbi:MAG: phenylacetate--CoA ligase [Mucinivorans sp.]
MIWNPTKECMSRQAMRELQSERLRQTVHRVYHNTPFYRAKMQELGLTPDDIRSVDDLHLLPFTTKQDLRDNYPYGLFAVPMSEIIRLHASSGTTGLPTVVGYTRKDLSIWAEMIARGLTAFGADKHDIFSVAYGYGLFTGGLGMHYGVENLGATVIPMSSGNTAKQIQLMHDFGPTALACTPSYAMFLGEQIEKSQFDISEFKLRLGIFGAEPWTDNMRRQIEEKLHIDAYNIYGLSEIMGPGVAHECVAKNGSHIIEDHFLPEIVEPGTLKTLPYGTQGELVFTTLTKEGLPLLRYRTKDLCTLMDGKCECGRTNVRMSRIVGRSDDMLIIRGVNVFPSQVESVILELEEFCPHYLLVVDRQGTLDTLEVQVEMQEEYYSDEISKIQSLRSKLAHRLQSVLGISADVKIVEPQTIARSEGKSQHVIDKRNLK